MNVQKPLRVLLVGNPNVGKSTVFNALTGLHQHTGNWPGKTVDTAVGTYDYKGRRYELVDLPGTYSLEPKTPEEAVALEALDKEHWDCVVAVCDGTCLKRNLILVLELFSRQSRVVVLVNLLDEACRRGIRLDCDGLSRHLGVPVIPCAAGKGEGLDSLREEIRLIAEDYVRPCPIPVPENRRERVSLAATTAGAVQSGRDSGRERQQLWDRLLTGRKTGIPIMLLLLFFLLWLTVAGANVPSKWLMNGFAGLYQVLYRWMSALGSPWWLKGALLDGMLMTAGRVIAVMLPPMAIFFPLFTLLEDLGYLPRVAYVLDHAMEKSGACGKMALTMCMGLGCNAVGVTGCRIIDSPRERILATVTNSFVPCNGRFGALILLLSAFLIPAGEGSAKTALGLLICLVFSVSMTLLTSALLSKTVLRGMPSAFALELPPYRKPQVGTVILRSILDRTLTVLGRAAVVALPAGLVLWILGAVPVGEGNLLSVLARWLNPVGTLLGMNGAVLLAFILGFPANEIVLPIVVWIASGSFGDVSAGLAAGLQGAGFTLETALATAVFFMLHWPCGTTCLTIYRETGSVRWTLAAAALPTAMGAILCMGIHGLFCLL